MIHNLAAMAATWEIVPVGERTPVPFLVGVCEDQQSVQRTHQERCGERSLQFELRTPKDVKTRLSTRYGTVVPSVTARKPLSSPPYRIGYLVRQIPKSRAVCLGKFPPVLRVPGEPVWKLLHH